MSELYMGLISGTSVDGIDAALVDFSQSQPVLVDSIYQAFSPVLRHEILTLCRPGENEIIRLGELDVKLGHAFASVANQLLEKTKLHAQDIQAIGSHGQTIRHHPRQRFTLQIGDPNIIATETNITTVADFRRRDMALGGEGAPLVPAFHQAVFATKNQSRVIANIGGIANITVLSEDQVVGFDTGPGNTLLNAWIEKHLQKTYDANGAWGYSGQINSELLTQLLNDEYFKLTAPKSTGPEHFNLAWLEKFLPKNLAPVDVQTTLTELTAISLVRSIPLQEGEVFVCGGGAHNAFLLSRIREHAKNLTISTTEKLGVHPDWVEAMAFAWLAKQTLNKKAGNLPEVTGAKSPVILGGVYAV